MGIVPFEYDATLKQLFACSVRGLLTQLAGSPVAELLDTELPRVNTPRLDLLARLRDGTLFHLEFQTTNEPAFARRAARYYLDIWERYGEAPRQVVLYLGRESLRLQHSFQTLSMSYEIQVVDVGALDGDTLAESGDLGDLILSVVARVRSRPEAVRRALAHIATLKGEARRLALAQLAILAGLRHLQQLVWEEARDMMLFEIDHLENGWTRDAYLRGERQLVRLLLDKRFGPLPEWVETKLAGAGPEELERWGVTVLEASSLEGVLGRE